jgi:hypothetical protein
MKEGVMARPRGEIADDVLRLMVSLDELGENAKQAFQLGEAERISLVEQIVDTHDQIDKYLDEFDSMEANA